MVNSGTSPAVPLDRIIFDLAKKTGSIVVGEQLLPFGRVIGGYAKNGCLYITFTGTTGVTIDLTALSAAVGVTSFQAGDTSLATGNAIAFVNLSTSGTITVAPGGSNPSNFPKFTGTTPTLSSNFGGTLIMHDPNGVTIDSTHKTILLTPSAGGAMAIAYGGA